jgi:hypothetical protein
MRQLAYASLNRQRWQQAARGRRRSELPWRAMNPKAAVVAGLATAVASVPVAVWTDTPAWASSTTSLVLGFWWGVQTFRRRG